MAEKNIKEKVSKMDEILKNYEEFFKIPKEGDILEGKIIEITNNAIYVDLGRYGTGVIMGREIFDEKDTFKNAEINDSIKGSVVETENEDGYIELSLKKASRDEAWRILKEKLESRKIFPTRILEANRGGLIVRVAGIVGFLPVSQLSMKYYPRVEGGDKDEILNRLSRLVGKDIEVQVIDAEQEEEKLIVSEKAVSQNSVEKKISKLKIGDIIQGKITGVVDFGAFIEFNDLEGLIHISELAWQRIDDPHKIVKVGDKVNAQVISIDGARVSLSLKRLAEDPWQKAVKKYKLDDIVQGKIIKITPFGVFVEVEKDFHGLAHISELGADFKKLEEKIKVGDKVKFKIISIEPEERKLGLSLKIKKTKINPVK